LVCSFIPSFVFANKEGNPVVSGSWLDEVMENIRNEEYKPSIQESDYKGERFNAPKYHLVNRANNLRAYFDGNGMELIPRVITDEENWNLKIKSIAVTSGNNDKKIFNNVDVALDGDNILCTGDGIKIVYSNSESGIEQNLSIEEQIEGEGILSIDFIIETENLDIAQEKDKFVLSGKEDEIIYQITAVEDANGKEISYSLSGNEGNLSISPDNDNVVYPIKITTNITSTNPSAPNLSVSTSAKGRGLSLTPSWVAEPNQDSTYFGCSVSSAGDVNGDGYSDVIIGSIRYDNGQTDEGRAFVYYGSSGGLSTSPNWTAESDQANALFGNCVSSAGDVNGDGYSDVIVGVYQYDNGQTDEGRAYVYYGNNYGLSLIPTQSLTNGSHLVQLGNATGSGGVQLNLRGRTPAGRGKVKLQWEIKPLGQPFNGTSLSESSSWYSTGVNGITISEDATGLSQATAYHWRVRLKYSPLNYNGSVHSRWLSIGPNGWNETDFITTSLSGIEDYTDGSANLQLSVFPSISMNIFSINFYVSEKDAKEDISLKVYNKAGMVVKNLFAGKKPAGRYGISWNGTNNSSQPLPNDIYFISLKKGEEKPLVKKIVLLR
jgi:hypothetical protein